MILFEWIDGAQMKKLIIVFIISFVVAGPAFAAKEPRIKAVIAVDNFRNDSCHAREWWRVPTGADISVSLINQLIKSGKFDIIKNDITSDHIMAKDLDIDGRILKNSALRVGQLTGAEYLVMFQVNGFEDKIAIDQQPAFSFGGGGGETEGTKTLSVEISIVNASTGETEFTNIITGTSSGDKNAARDFRGEFSGALYRIDDTNLGKALRASVVKIQEYLECVMVDRDSCLVKYKLN